MFNNYYTYKNNVQLVSTPYADLQTAELIAIMAMRNSDALIETNVVSKVTGEIVKTFIKQADKPTFYF